MSKKKIITLALVAIIAVTAIASASIAYFTDTKTANNVFTLGNVMIKLDEAKVKAEDDKWTIETDDNGEEVRVKSNDYGAAYPGAVLPKDPTVHNVGTNPAYIRAKVTVSEGMNLLAVLFPDIQAGDFTKYPDAFKAFINNSLGEGWTVEDFEWGEAGWPDLMFILKYDGKLAAGESTTPMFTEITIPADYDARNGHAYYAEMTIKVDVVAEAIQTNGFDSWEAAFAAFDA